MRNRQNTDVLLGFVTGVFANAIGVFLWWVLFSDFGIEQTFVWAYREKLLGAIISMGALLDLLLFFVFLRFSHDSRAKGVLIWVFIIAFVILYLKIR